MTHALDIDFPEVTFAGDDELISPGAQMTVQFLMSVLLHTHEALNLRK